MTSHYLNQSCPIYSCTCTVYMCVTRPQWVNAIHDSASRVLYIVCWTGSQILTWSWCRQMETYSALLTLYEGDPLDSPHKGQWRGALMFSLICAWTNGWANSRDTGDLGCHHALYDVTVMSNHCSRKCICKLPPQNVGHAWPDGPFIPASVKRLFD